MNIAFPKYLSIQTTSFCNGHCIFCPSIIDIAPTILGLFEITKPEEMQGRVLFRDEIK